MHDIDTMSSDELRTFLNDLDEGMEVKKKRDAWLRRLPFEQLLDEAVRTSLPDEGAMVWERAIVPADWDRLAQALRRGLSPTGAFQAIAVRRWFDPVQGREALKPDQFRKALDVLLSVATRGGLEALIDPSDVVPIPVWLDGFNRITFSRMDGWAHHLEAFGNAGYTVPTDVLVTNAIREEQRKNPTLMRWSDSKGPVRAALIRHMLSRTSGDPGHHLVEGLLDDFLEGMDPVSRDEALDHVLDKVENSPAQVEHVRLLMARGLQVKTNHLLHTPADLLPTLMAAGQPILPLIGDGYLFERAPTEKRAKRVSAVLTRLSANVLNGPAGTDEHQEVNAFPLWLTLFFTVANMDNDDEAFQTLLASGADVTREGVARHFPDEQKAQAVDRCLKAVDRVRMHVEEAELRAVAEKAVQDAQSVPSRGRKRL